MELPTAFNLRALRVFNMVVEAGNMTRAAKNLNVTQSSISETISQLEDAVGAKLFERDMRPIRLTASGAHLHQHSNRLLQSAEEVFNSVRGAGAIGLPSLTIAMVESVVDILGPTLVGQLNHMALQWRIWSGNSQENQTALLNRSAEIIISGSSELEDLDGSELFPLVQESFVVIVPPAWNVTNPDPTDLADRPFIRYSLRSAIGQQIERQINRMRLPLPFRSEFDTISGVQSAVANGLGWSFSTPLCLINEANSLDNVVVAPLKRAAFTRRLTLVGRKGLSDQAPSILARVAREAIQNRINETLQGPRRWMASHIEVLG